MPCATPSSRRSPSLSLIHISVAYNGRFYFIGTRVGTESVADAATGIPSIFEVNPEDDSFRTVYQAVDMDEYRAMQQAHVFPIPRAIAVYQGSLIASVTQMDGAHIIAYTPDADDFNADGSFKGIQVKDGNALRNSEFQEIAEPVSYTHLGCVQRPLLLYRHAGRHGERGGRRHRHSLHL